MSSTSETDIVNNQIRIDRTSFIKKALWRVERLGYAVLEGTLGRLPSSWACGIGERLAGLFWHLLPQRRFAVINNLRMVLGDRHSMREIEGMAEECFRRVGGNLLAAACTARMKPEQLGEVLKVDNPEVIEAAIAEGKGVVLILAHMGNWELLSRMIHFYPKGTKVGAVYRVLNNPIMDTEVLKRRQADGTRMFSKRDQFHQIAGFVREGGVLGVLSDQRVGRGGDLTTYFGRHTRISPIPRLLARRTGCKVMSLALMEDGLGHWRARYIPVEDPRSIESCTQALEQAILTSPLDVFWLQQRWKTHIKTGRKSLRSWLPEKAGRSDRPHRILLWLDQLPADWTLGEEWIHEDVDYELALRPGAPEPSELPPIAHRHDLPEDHSAESLGEWIFEIDRSDMRPLDAVIAMSAPANLEKVCDQLGIDLVDPSAPLRPRSA